MSMVKLYKNEKYEEERDERESKKHGTAMSVDIGIDHLWANMHA
jgi:hypothetical protein